MPSTNSSRSASSVGDSSIASGRSRSSSSRALDAEDGSLAARVDRLEDGRERDDGRARRRRRRPSAGVAYGGCGSPLAPSVSRIARLCVRRCAVCVPMPGRAELLGDGGHDGDGAIGGHREHAVDADTSRDLDHLVDAREVDDLRRRRPTRGPARPRCGRPPRRAGRGRAPARSRGADGARRRRREPSSRPPMLTRLEAPTSRRPAAGATGETRAQRLISQPFVRLSVAHTRFPATVPTTRARCGPP